MKKGKNNPTRRGAHLLFQARPSGKSKNENGPQPSARVVGRNIRGKRGRDLRGKRGAHLGTRGGKR